MLEGHPVGKAWRQSRRQLWRGRCSESWPSPVLWRCSVNWIRDNTTIKSPLSLSDGLSQGVIHAHKASSRTKDINPVLRRRDTLRRKRIHSYGQESGGGGVGKTVNSKTLSAHPCCYAGGGVLPLRRLCALSAHVVANPLCQINTGRGGGPERGEHEYLLM